MGSRLLTLLSQVKYDASYMIAFSDGGYTTNLPLEEVLGGKAWVVDTQEAERGRRVGYLLDPFVKWAIWSFPPTYFSLSWGTQPWKWEGNVLKL